MAAPTISVVMSVLNGEKYLHDAIKSVLDQSFGDFELIIVSELESNDETLKIIGSFDDKRLVRLHNKTHLGLIKSLNLGLSRARGKYIARMDGDDICERDRLEKQYDYLEKHPEVSVVGAAVTCINDMSEPMHTIFYPCQPNVVRWEMFLHSAVANPTSMIRREILDRTGLYDESTPLAEDYSLWLRVLRSADIANLPITLARYRIHSGNISSLNNERGSLIANHLACDAIVELLGRNVEAEDVACLRDRSIIKTSARASSASRLLADMLRTYLASRRLSLMEKVQVRMTALRIQMAISLRVMNADPIESMRLMGGVLIDSPSSSIFSMVPALGELLSYNQKIKRTSRRH